MGRPIDMRSRRGPKGYQRSDDRLREEIIDKLLQQSDIELDEIEVDVTGGKVTLSGNIDNRRVKHQIEDIVDSVWGVKEIANNLRIQSNMETYGQRSQLGPNSWGGPGRTHGPEGSGGGLGRPGFGSTGNEGESSPPSSSSSRTPGTSGSSGKSR
jgi:hypothetical protein